MAADPANAATDVLLVAVAFVLGLRLERSGARAGQPGRRLWGACFVLVAVAAASGTLRHGLRPLLAPRLEGLLWVGGVLSIAAASALLLAGAAAAEPPGPPRRLLTGLAAAKLALVAPWLLRHRGYTAVAIDAVASAALAAWLLARAGRAGRFAGRRHLLQGVAIGTAGAALREAGVSPHPAFDENALFHVILLASLVLLYRGGLALGPGPEDPSADPA